MKYIVKLLRAHFTVEFIMLFRYPLDLASLYLVVTLVLAGIFIGIGAFVPAGKLVGDTKSAVFVGYFFWTFYLMTVNNASWEITMAANQGYLEREFLTPAGHTATVFSKILCNTFSGLLHYALVTTICALLFGIRLTLDAPSVLLVLGCCYLFLVGTGLAFAGLALVFKRIGNVISVFQMVLMVLSFAALGNYGHVVSEILRWFPYTQSIRLLRAVLAGGETFSFVIQPANLIPLAAGGVAFFILGIVVFRILDRVAMDRGLIGQF
jgi:ABC-2 type transport system permease protein